eukprot:3240313-Karenia_brevis.AAC.1
MGPGSDPGPGSGPDATASATDTQTTDRGTVRRHESSSSHGSARTGFAARGDGSKGVRVEDTQPTQSRF